MVLSGRRAKIVAGLPVVSSDELHVRLQHAAYRMACAGRSRERIDGVYKAWRAWLWGRPQVW